MTYVNDYRSAAEFLAGGRDKHSRPIENNTRIERRGERIAVRLHGTDVVTYEADGTVELNTGGWYTVTTKDRINNYNGVGIRVASARGRWFLARYGDWDRMVPFFDGIRLDPEGNVLNPRPADEEAKAEQARKVIERDMRKYIDGFAKALNEGIPAPSAGDCWFCSMFEPSGMGNPDHLLSHFEDGYYVASLLGNAVKERGYGDFRVVLGMRLDQEALKDEIWRVRRAWGNPNEPDRGSLTDLKRDLRRYLKKRLLPGGGVTPVGEPVGQGAW